MSAALRAAALEAAVSQLGVRETSRNSGPEVDAYLSTVNMPPGNSWCAAFAYWCFSVGAAAVRAANPCPRTAGALKLYDKAHIAARLPPTAEPAPGDLFVIDHGHGLGHVGFVEELRADGTLGTVEGNTNGGGAREGDGVYRRVRKRAEVTRGYLRLG